MDDNKPIVKKYTPLLIVIGYLFFTELLFFFGPIKFGVINNSKLLFYLFIYKIMLIIGFIIGSKVKKRDTIYKWDNNDFNYDSLKKLIRTMIVVSIITNIIFIVLKTNTFSISELIHKIIIGFINPSSNYKEKLVSTVSDLYKLYAPIYTLSSVITFPVLPLIFYYFGKMNGKTKIIAIICVFFEASRWAIIGTNKGIIDIFIIALSIYYLKKLQNNKNNKMILNIKKTFFKIILVLMFIGTMNFFFNNINSRLLNNNNYLLLSLNGASFKNDSLWNKNNSFFPISTYIQSYLSQGYYGMGLALNSKFDSMYGLGSSKVIIEKVQSKLSYEFLSRSYILKDEMYGWSSTVNWHTAYTWFANDISFCGVIILMFILGFYFAKIIIYAVNNKDWFFIPLFSCVMLIFFYIPMNNQIFANPYQFVGFVSLNALWFRKKRINNRK